jgi:hypothetical protein
LRIFASFGIVYTSQWGLMKAPQQRAAIRSWAKAGLAAALALILVIIAGFIYSPWHRHDRATRQPCIFQPVEASPGLEAGPQIAIESPMAAVWPAAGDAVLPSGLTPVKPRSGRAPPA